MSSLNDRKLFLFLFAAMALLLSSIFRVSDAGSRDFASELRNSQELDNCIKKAINSDSEATCEIKVSDHKTKTGNIESTYRVPIKKGKDGLEAGGSVISTYVDDECETGECKHPLERQISLVTAPIDNIQKFKEDLARELESTRSAVNSKLAKDAAAEKAKNKRLESCDAKELENGKLKTITGAAKITCLKEKLADMDPDLQKDYFDNNVVKLFQTQLESDDPSSVLVGKNIMNQFASSITSPELKADLIARNTTANVKLVPAEMQTIETQYNAEMAAANGDRRLIAAANQKRNQANQRLGQTLLTLNNSIAQMRSNPRFATDAANAARLASAATSLNQNAQALARMTEKNQRDADDIKHSIDRRGRMSRNAGTDGGSFCSLPENKSKCVSVKSKLPPVRPNTFKPGTAQIKQTPGTMKPAVQQRSARPIAPIKPAAPAQDEDIIDT